MDYLTRRWWCDGVWFDVSGEARLVTGDENWSVGEESSDKKKVGRRQRSVTLARRRRGDLPYRPRPRFGFLRGLL